MYIMYTGAGGQYASAAVSSRDGKKTSVSYTYLGRVIDREKGIYKSAERGVFTFDPRTGKYGVVPEDFTIPNDLEGNTRGHVSVDFGDAFFVNEFLWRSGLMKVIDQIGYGNPDTLRAMLLFYILSGLSNRDAVHWYEGSIARMLYPAANMTSQRISDFLAAIGTPDRRMSFQKAYISYVFERYGDDRNILVDSSGLPNSAHIPETRINVHNGKVSNEVRLIFVVQKSTGLPLYYRAVPGNIVDVSTLERIFLHLDSMGVDIESCIIDAGYNSGDNLDLFYNADHTCKIGFITRVSPRDKNFKQMLEEELPTIDRKENFVKYGDRFLFIRKRKVMVGARKDNPAWIYFGLDCGRANDECHKLLKNARDKKLSTDDVYEAMQTQGLFAIFSGKEYGSDEILPAYYQRQAAEQIFDFAKNYTKLLPLRTSTEETFQGHLLLSYIAACAVKMIQMKLNVANLFLGSRLAILRNQKCTIYNNRVVTDMPQKEVNKTYEAFGMKSPASIPVVGNKLQYVPPEEDTHTQKKKSSQSKKRTFLNSDIRDSAGKEDSQHKKAGRPKGSKNKKTIEREASEPPMPKRGPGRPKGSKNKKTLERETEQTRLVGPPKRGPGRPKGSKNKPKNTD